MKRRKERENAKKAASPSWTSQSTCPRSSLACAGRCVEIQRSKISLFGSRNHAKRPIPLYRRDFLRHRLSIKKRIISPVIPFNQPMQNKRADANQKASKPKGLKNRRQEHIQDTRSPALSQESSRK